MPTAKPSFVYLIVERPNPSTLSHNGQQIVTLETHRFEIKGTIDETIKAHCTHLPVGTTIHVTTDARCDTYTLAAQLEPAK